MSDVNSNININIDASAALGELKRLQSELSQFYTSMNRGGAAAAANATQLQQNLINSINATGQFTASMQRIKTTTESFTTALEKNKLSMREYFRYSMGSIRAFRGAFSSEFDTIDKVARERVKTLQTQYIKLGRDATGAMQSIAVRPQTLDLKDLGTQTAIASQRMQILNQLVAQGSTNLLNFGKNTQWAGRQLMVGFSIPLAIAGSAAAKEFMKLEEQAIRFKRVYGDTFTPSSETDQMIEQIRNLGVEYTKYGVAVEKTMALAADAAAMGKQGADLLAQVNEASRLAVLGGVDQQKALETTTSLTNAFGTATEDLAGKVSFLNAVENQTVTSIDDLTTAIPTAAPVIKQLGGSVEDLAFFLTAMREGGINASEGANALKSGLASIINPTQEATDMLANMGINLQGIVDRDKGNVKQMLIDIGTALNSLDPTNRARAIEQLFGKFQFARMSTLFQNITKEGSQASRVLDLTQRSAAELAILSEREMKKIEDSPMYKFQAAVEKFQASMAPLGEAFLKAVTPIVEFGTNLLNEFNKWDDGAKNFAVMFAAIVGGIGPVLLMAFGLVANGVANVIKLFQGLGKMLFGAGRGSQVLGEQLDYMTQQQLEAASVAASLDQAHNNLIQVFTSEKGAVDNLAAAYERASIAASGLARVGTVGGGKGGKSARKMAGGGIVSGPGGPTSDSVPAMLSNGEAIIPAETVKRYPGLVSGLIAGNVGHFAGGGTLGERYVNDPGQPDKNKLGFQANFKKLGMLGYSAEADQIKERLLEANVAVSTARRIISRAVGVVSGGGSISDFVEKMNTSLTKWKGSGSRNAKLLVEDLDKRLGLTEKRTARTTGDFAHIGSGINMSASEYKKKFGTDGLSKSQIGALERMIAQNGTVSIKSGLGMSNFDPRVNRQLAKQGASQSDVLAAYKASGMDKWNESIKIGGGNVQELAGSTKKFDQELQRLIGKVSKGTTVFDTQAQAEKFMADNAGKAATSLEKLYASAIKTADPKLQQALLNSQSAAREFRAGSASRRVSSNLPGGLVPLMLAQAKRELGSGQTQTGRTSRRISEQEARAAMTRGEKSAYTKALNAEDTALQKKLLDAKRRQIRAAESEAQIAERQAESSKRSAAARQGWETRRAKAEAQAAAAAEADATARKRGIGSRIASGVKGMGRGGGMAAGMAISAGLSIASGVGGPVGDVASALAPVAAGASFGSMFGAWGIAIGGAVGGLVAGITAYNKAIDEAKQAGQDLANAMTMTGDKLTSIGEMTGRVSISEAARKESSMRFAGFNKDSSRMEFGKTFLESEPGKAFMEDINTQVKNKKSWAEISDNVSSQLATAVAQGVLTKQEADSIALNLAEQLKNKQLGVSIQGKLTEILGPNGEKLGTDPGSVTLNIAATSNKEAKATGTFAAQQVQQTEMQGAGQAAALGGLGAVAGGLAVAGAVNGWNPVGWGLLAAAGVTAITGAIIQWTNAEAEAVKQATLSADMYSRVYQQNVQLVDVVKSRYDKLIEEKKALEAAATTDAERAKYAEQITILEERRTAAINNQNAQTQTTRENALATKNQLGDTKWDDANKKQITDTTYQGDATGAALATQAYDFVSNESNIGNKQTQATLELQITSKTLDPTTAQTLATALAKGGEEAQLDYTAALNVAGDQKVVDMVTGLTAAGANEDTINKQLDIIANIKNPEEAAKATDDILKLLDISTSLKAVGIDIDINTDQGMAELQKIQDRLDDFQASGMSLDMYVKTTYTSEGFEMTQEERDYYNSLSPSEQKVYQDVYLTVKETIDTGTEEGRARLREWAGGNLGKYQTGTTGGGWFGWGATATYDYNKMAHDMLGEQTKAAVAEAPAPEPTPTPENTGPSGGGAPQKAPRTVEDVISDQQKVVAQTADQRTAMQKLTASGLSLADAYKAVSNAEDASLIANAANTEQLQRLTQATKDAELATKNLAAAQSLAASVQENIDKKALALKLAADKKLSDVQKQAILNNKDLSTLYMTPTFDPTTLQKALQDAANAKTLELQIKKLTISGMQDIWKQGMDAASQTFSAKENMIKLTFDVKKSPFENIIKAGQRAIADIQNRPGGLDDLDADLQRISEKEKDINKAYDDKVKALDAVSKINDKIIAQQKSQLGLANALTQGDIAAAAQAAQDMRAQSSAGALDDQRAQLEAARKSSLDAVTGTSGLTRDQIEEKIRVLKAQVLEIEEKSIEPAQRRVELLDRMQQDQIDSLTVLGKTKEQWDMINGRLELANTQTKDFATNMKEALGIVTSLTAALAKNGVSTINILPTGTSYFAKGGAVKLPQYMKKGTDTIPAMLSQGEFVMTKPAVDKIGLNNLAEMNRGRYQHQESSSVYNINVQAQTDASPEDIARVVMQKLNGQERYRAVGNRF